MHKLGVAFGLDEEAVKEGIAQTISGAVATMYQAGLSPAEVMDLIPVKPLGEDESTITTLYQTKLTALFQKLKP